MKILDIITITYESVIDVTNTLNSISEISSFSQVYIVHKCLGNNDIQLIKQRFSDYSIIFIQQLNVGIYGAMNIGLRYIDNKYVHFLNAGDEFSGEKNFLLDVLNNANPNEILVFDTNQVYGDDVYVRSSALPLSKGSYASLAHQAIMVPSQLAKRHDFDHRYPITADRKWMEVLFGEASHIYYGVPVVNFYLGGVSNFPTLKTVKIRYIDGGFKSALKECIKLSVRLLVSNRTFYAVMNLRYAVRKNEEKF